MSATPPSTSPLCWPFGWPRKEPAHRANGKFRSGNRSITVAAAVDRLEHELERCAAVQSVLSTNLATRLDGSPRSSQPEPRDPGVALYFTLGGRPMVLACDTWNAVAQNIAAIAAHLGALRSIDRWGVGTVEQLFTGYLAVPAPGAAPSSRTWQQVLSHPATLADAELAYRIAMRSAHPDRGGDPAAAAELNAAIAEARRVFG